jgi:hypothetical protein
LPRLEIDVEARFASVQDGLEKISRQVDKSAKNWERAFSGLGSALATLGVTASVGGLVAFAKAGIDAADDIGKLAQKVGVTTESLSAMQYAAKLSDVSNEQLATGLARLARAASDAAAGSKESSEAFQAIGVAVKDSNGNLRSTEDLLLDIADRFSKMEDGAGKTALAMRIFGRAGADLIPLLNAGRSGFEEFRREAERVGRVISSDTAKAAEEFNDNMTRLGIAAGSAKFALAESLLPTLTRVAQGMADAVLEGEGLIGVLKALTRLSPFGDLQRAQKELVELTDRIMLGERRLAEMTVTPMSKPVADALKERIEADTKRANELVKLLGVLRGETDAFGDPKKPTVEKAKTKAPTITDSAATNKAASDAKRAAEQAERERSRLIKMGNDEWVRYIDEQIAGEKELAEAAHRAALQRERENEELLRTGRVGWVAYAEAVFAAADEENLALAKIAEDANKTSDAARELGLTFSSAFEDAVVGGKKFSDVLRGLAQDIARLVLRKSVTEPLAQAGSKLFDKFDLSKILGFATGGSFMVGGSGGTDSQLVAFKASPHERVIVETPEQQRRGGGNSFNFSIDARGADSGVAERIQRAVRDAVHLSLQAVQAQSDRGGSFARAVGRR